MILGEIREGVSKIPRIKTENESTVYQNPDAAEAALRGYCVAMSTHLEAIRDIGWGDE